MVSVSVSDNLKIYFYLTYELGVELVIYWMCRLIICGTICVNFDSIKSWKLMEDVNDQRIIHCYIPSQELLTFINCVFENN